MSNKMDAFFAHVNNKPRVLRREAEPLLRTEDAEL